MSVLFLFLISLLFLVLAFKHAQIGSSDDLVYITLFCIFILFTFTVPLIYDCNTYNKEITVKVIDKYITQACYAKDKGCGREYILVLETQKGYKYESPFSIEYYYQFNVKDKLTYTPTICHLSKILFDK